ncbi:hypothetical protein E1B28_003504 [Marasmius oreades]|uniref:Uncharacterized protein n=1 Tax=Marasmius oreades TaxID=181124 RepID=A0A9P7RM41_9AGAR|nr:uncharacterized protein E1B28_003504 [Marasmius oreades]KAG7085980.1 hypothetical protein E1B28_003504 [Marasmius oreades]
MLHPRITMNDNRADIRGFDEVIPSRTVEKKLDSFQNTPSPILKLPADILLPIVKICANDDEEGNVMSIRSIQ